MNFLPGGAAQGCVGGRPPPQNLAVYETKLTKIRLPKIQKIALCRVRPPRLKYVQPALCIRRLFSGKFHTVGGFRIHLEVQMLKLIKLVLWSVFYYCV